MSVAFVPVQWTRAKWVYDGVLLIAVALYLGIFMGAWSMWGPPVDGWILRARAFGSCAFLLLTVILCGGPLARLDPRFLPLLYNRRHAGVICCVLALIHADAVLSWYFAFSATDPYAAALGVNTGYGAALGFPVEPLGAFALVCLGLLAATSHDAWLSLLGPPVWKRLHLLIYPAYAAVAAHVMLGAAQGETSAALGWMAGLGAAAVAGLHLAARGRAPAAAAGDWVEVPEVDAIEEGRARVVALPGGARASVWRHEGRLWGLSNACAHQNGPLGEGRILDGCVTCPWHGFQYRVQDGRSPAPFTERVPTHRLRREGARVLIEAAPQLPGDPTEGLKA